VALSSGYITQKQAQIWDFKRKGCSESDIARKLRITRQTVHKAADVANMGIESALVEAANLNRISIEKTDAAQGILVGQSIEFRTPAIITFSSRNGLQVWYKHEGDCGHCERNEKCKSALLAEMEDRRIMLREDVKSIPPSRLAELLFKSILRDGR
jgi:transcriptional regulator